MRDTSLLIADLIALEPIKTWSLIVTLFGDLGDRELSGKEVGAILSRLQIKPEAIRVALHRLRKDGWIETRKTGREVAYRLSGRAHRETDAVRDDVYCQTPKFSDGWTLALLADDGPATPPPPGMVALARNAWLIPKGASTELELLTSEDLRRPIPSWVEAKLLPKKASPMVRRLTEIAKECQGFVELTDEVSGAIRLLVLHRWRKLAIRSETWAHIGLVPDGVLAQCHGTVTSFLATTNRLDLSA